MVYNVLDYNAHRCGSILCTKEIQKAIDDCFLNGGGEVVIPEGRYLVGGLRLRSGVTLHLLENAVLLGSINPDDYMEFIHDEIEPIAEEDLNALAPNVVKGVSLGKSARPYSRWNNAIIRAINAENIEIIGERGSEINGQNCFDEQGEEKYRGPHAINMWFCKNIKLSGYTVRDSANWAHAIHNSRNIEIRELTVLGGHDGIDIRTCDDVLIENCRLCTGDDCIAGFDNIGVTIRNCYFDCACSWLRFGGTDVLVENCQGVAPSTYGFRGSLTEEQRRERANTTEECRHSCHNVFLYYCDNRAEIRRTPGNIVIRNGHFKNPDTVMRLPFGHVWCCNRSLADITFENCVIEGICKPLLITAPDNEPLTLRLRNCVITPRKGYEDIPFIEGENIRELELTDTELRGFTDPCLPK